MYFTIKISYYDSESNKIQLNTIESIEKSKNIIDEFSEIKSFNDINNSKHIYDYFYIDIKDTRKLKLLSLHDNDVKQKLTRLETMLYNEKLVKLSDDKPSTEGSSTGIGGSSISINKFKKQYFTIKNEKSYVF